MQPLSIHIVEKFAQHFAYKKNGFTLTQITPYFEQYQGGLPTPGFNGIIPTKREHFVQVVLSMKPRNQRISLIDLCLNPPSNIKNCPSLQEREYLLKLLLQSDGSTPLAYDLSLPSISVSGIREQWWTASSRILNNPASAITAAKSLIESTCKTIIKEYGSTPDCSGNLQKLLKQTLDILNLKTGGKINESINKVISGLFSLINGLSQIRNEAGDSHGKEYGLKFEDITIASLMVHAAGVITLFLTQFFLEKNYINFKENKNEK